MRSLPCAIAVILCVTPAGGAQSLQERMIDAEDARASTAAAMAPILTGLRSPDPRVAVQAVRALGRFERPELVRQILPLVTHARPEVRAEAINALGQALARVPRDHADTAPLPPEVATVVRTLTARLRADADPTVTGTAAETLGRLPHRRAESVVETERLLASLLPAPPAGAAGPVGPDAARDVHPASVAGAVKGLETLVRVYRTLQAISPDTTARLRTAATLGADRADGDLAYIRRIAWLALNGSGGADPALVERALDDRDPQVRRNAVLALRTMSGADAFRPALLAKALRDPSYIVRFEAVRTFSRTRQAQDCAPVLAAVDDEHPHVALEAIDALGAGCPGAEARLVRVLDAAPEGRIEWHRAAHGIVSLARVARAEAARRLPAFERHAVWQMRMYAARAAEAAGDADVLERLARDPHDNVREAAVRGLSTLRQHEADAIFVEQLARPDYQLVMTAAKALEGTPRRDAAVPALLAAFARMTTGRRDTSRDVRIALVERIAELGTKAQAPALQSCLEDFDPVVAALCARTLEAWTGATHAARPAPRPAAPVARAAAGGLRFTMRRGGSFDLRLFHDEAPATIARVVGLARSGYYNGLTFHRVEPNFVLQGGSPGANEYMGDGAFMRDELGRRTHARGTLGISTRGRDTGDAQVFVNLLDNVRLDHNFTVFAEVAAGIEVVDRILEGDVIERVDVLEQAPAQSRP
jgi:cyclophilin family peptidyl-prolyl cis-trans isomerase/HEAT repeat protein